MRNLKLKAIEVLVKLVIALYAYFFICVAFAANNAKNNYILDNQIQRMLESERIKYQIPGLSVSIKFPEKGNPKNFVSGYYSLSNNKKITSNTLFQIGSMICPRKSGHMLL